MFALLDCNNFFVSCERAFNPALEGKPVVVLSNNDGCFIARSNEAKALDIPMGAPFFKYKQVVEKYDIKVFSSNFELYGDLSERIMNILSHHVPKMEIYSIDEAFLDLSHLKTITELENCAKDLRQKILDQTGIPTSIGVGNTKVLAKIANEYAKKKSKSNVFIINESNREEILSNVLVEDIWGVGRNLSNALYQVGIKIALDLANSNGKSLRKLYNVGLEKIQLELNGIRCIKIDDAPANKKSIASTRSFGRAVEKLEELHEAIANYTFKASEKLRQQECFAGSMYVFLRTNRFKNDYIKNSKIINFSNPTDDSSYLIKTAKDLINEIYIKGAKYKKAGVILLNLQDKNTIQNTLLAEHIPNEKLMAVMDKINIDHGKNSLFFASQGIKRYWQMKSDLRSPRYTTNWDEIPKVK